MKLKEVLKKLGFLLWKDNSLRGWIFSIIFLFIFIKFIFFPIMSLVTGTPLPLAIVESCSMYHNGNLLSDYNEWWEDSEPKYSEYEIEKQDFTFKKGLNKGDILFIIGKKPEKLNLGDVIIFNTDHKNPIIHRIIKIEEADDKYFFSTIGDNNNGQMSSEVNIKSEQIVGKAIFKIAPYLGWAKLIFFEYNQRESNKGFCN